MDFVHVSLIENHLFLGEIKLKAFYWEKVQEVPFLEPTSVIVVWADVAKDTIMYQEQ